MDAIYRLSVYWGLSYSLHLLMYFTQGYLQTVINRHFPQRCIQPRQQARTQKRIKIEIIYSVKSLIITSGCLAVGVWLQAQGWTLFPPAELNWVSGISYFILSVVLFDAWFYWAHRLMHTKPLYPFHRLHHQSVAPSVWSNYSDSSLDALLHQSYYWLAPILLPIPAEVLIAHRLIDHINGQIGHSGYEFFADRLSRYPSPMLCVTFHDQHHQYFNYNFANFFSIWDRLGGTIHPQYDTTVASYDQKNHHETN